MLRRAQLSEIRAVTKSGVYSLKAPEKWPKIIGTRERIEAAYDAIAEVEKEKMQDLHDQMSHEERRISLQDRIISAFANEYGLSYVFERW